MWWCAGLHDHADTCHRFHLFIFIARTHRHGDQAVPVQHVREHEPISRFEHTQRTRRSWKQAHIRQDHYREAGGDLDIHGSARFLVSAIGQSIVAAAEANWTDSRTPSTDPGAFPNAPPNPASPTTPAFASDRRPGQAEACLISSEVNRRLRAGRRTD